MTRKKCTSSFVNSGHNNFSDTVLIFQALEMQGKPIEAVNELSKLCLVHRIFPPEEGSVSCLITK